jgi:hypothetical protein
MDKVDVTVNFLDGKMMTYKNVSDVAIYHEKLVGDIYISFKIPPTETVKGYTYAYVRLPYRSVVVRPSPAW